MCKCHPSSPFHWAEHPQDSIFVKDVTFRAKGNDGKSGAQIATDVIEKRREINPMLGTLHSMGSRENRQKEEERMLAYRQFGVYSRATPTTKQPNKHEK
jgi:hypothetical protein